MALKSSREGLRKEIVDYLGNLIIDDNLRNEIVKSVSNIFVTSESFNEFINNLTTQITTETDERIESDNTLQNTINAEVLARQNAITNLESLIREGVLQMDLLWTNASPESDFVNQKISLDLSKYRMLIIGVRSVRYITGAEIIDENIILPVIYDTFISHIHVGETCIRKITISEDGVTFSDAQYANSYNDNPISTNTTVYNNIYIPHKLYGVK